MHLLSMTFSLLAFLGIFVVLGMIAVSLAFVQQGKRQSAIRYLIGAAVLILLILAGLVMARVLAAG